MNTITRCHCRVAVWWNIKHVIWHGRWSLPGMEILEKSLNGMPLSTNFNQRGTLQEAGDLPQDLMDPRCFVFAHPKASRTPPCTPDRHAELRVGLLIEGANDGMRTWVTVRLPWATRSPGRPADVAYVIKSWWQIVNRFYPILQFKKRKHKKLNYYLPKVELFVSWLST